MRSRFLYPLLLGGSLAGYFLMFKKRKDVDYVLDGREQRMEEGRAASEKFRTHMQQKLHGTSGSRRDEQQEHWRKEHTHTHTHAHSYSHTLTHKFIYEPQVITGIYHSDFLFEYKRMDKFIYSCLSPS